MKKLRSMILLCAMMFFVAACQSKTSRTDTSVQGTETEQPMAQGNYTCPMHPEVTSDQPGECPKCGMQLVSVDSLDAERSDSLSM